MRFTGCYFVQRILLSVRRCYHSLSACQSSQKLKPLREASLGNTLGLGGPALPADMAFTVIAPLSLCLTPEAVYALKVILRSDSKKHAILMQGIAFFHAGSDILRSKSLDRDSYNSGDACRPLSEPAFQV